jgi:pimeloyl-ACP methyl ester carboxylesterase
LVTIGSPPLESTADFPGAFLSLADGVSLFKGNIDRREAEIIASFITENPALVSGMAESILAADPAARTLLFETLAVDPFHDECAFVSAAALPLLVCFGEKEKIVNLDYVREKGLKARLGDSLRIIPDAVHLPDLRSPDGFVPLLLTFLESIDA